MIKILILWTWDTLIVVSRFCWSSVPPDTLRYQGDIHRGVCAGDRFDIISAAALEEKDENGQQMVWTDVTSEVLTELYLAR